MVPASCFTDPNLSSPYPTPNCCFLSFSTISSPHLSSPLSSFPLISTPPLSSPLLFSLHLISLASLLLSSHYFSSLQPHLTSPTTPLLTALSLGVLPATSTDSPAAPRRPQPSIRIFPRPLLARYGVGAHYCSTLHRAHARSPALAHNRLLRCPSICLFIYSSIHPSIYPWLL